jgi:hypothetical protein
MTDIGLRDDELWKLLFELKVEVRLIRHDSKHRIQPLVSENPLVDASVASNIAGFDLDGLRAMIFEMQHVFVNVRIVWLRLRGSSHVEARLVCEIEVPLGGGTKIRDFPSPGVVSRAARYPGRQTLRRAQRMPCKQKSD